MNRSLKRKLSYGTNASLVTVFVVALVVLLFGVSERHRFRWDFSAEGSNRLQRDTLNKIRLIQLAGEPVRITGFTAQSGKQDSYYKNRALRDLLEEMDLASGSISCRFIDFDRERLTAEALGVTQYATVVVQRGEGRVDLRDRDLFRRRGRGENRTLEFLGEAAINQALSRLMSDQKRVIYSLVGHGEFKIDSTDPDGLAEVVALLEQEHYEVKELDLVRDRAEGSPPAVPDDASALLLARPRTMLSLPESDALVEYVSRGGAVMVLVDVGLPPPRLLARLGISVPDGTVMDKRMVYPYNDRPVLLYGRHSITRDLTDMDLVTVLSHVAPLKWADPAPDGIMYEGLLKTSRRGWIEMGGATENGLPVFDSRYDTRGPVTVALAIRALPGKGLVMANSPAARLVIMGDADWSTNAVINEGPGNKTFAVNTFRWLVGDEERLSVVGRPTSVRKLALTEEDTHMIRWVALGLGPVCVLMIGAAVWASRRGR